VAAALGEPESEHQKKPVSEGSARTKKAEGGDGSIREPSSPRDYAVFPLSGVRLAKGINRHKGQGEGDDSVHEEAQGAWGRITHR